MIALAAAPIMEEVGRKVADSLIDPEDDDDNVQLSN